MSNFIFKLQTFQINILEIFNNYRQYLFDDTSSSTDGKSIEEGLEESVYKTYDTIATDIDYIENYIAEYVPMNDEMSEFFNKDLCSFYITDIFNSHEECLKKYENSLKYTFIIFGTYFLQEIRIAKNIVKYLLSTGKILGSLKIFIPPSYMGIPNMPLIGIPNPGNYRFRFDLFNEEILHNYLNTIFINIVLPYLDTYRKILYKYLVIEGDNYTFIIISCIYLFSLIILFLVYWIPIIYYLNNIIYKTKNLLSIIPIDILANQNNIEQLISSNEK
jgi:hypothetical protein